MRIAKTRVALASTTVMLALAVTGCGSSDAPADPAHTTDKAKQKQSQGLASLTLATPDCSKRGERQEHKDMAALSITANLRTGKLGTAKSGYASDEKATAIVYSACRLSETLALGEGWSVRLEGGIPTAMECATQLDLAYDKATQFKSSFYPESVIDRPIGELQGTEACLTFSENSDKGAPKDMYYARFDNVGEPLGKGGMPTVKISYKKLG